MDFTPAFFDLDESEDKKWVYSSYVNLNNAWNILNNYKTACG